MIVLDTHIWIWWLNGRESELGASRIKKIQEADQVCVSAISCFEVVWLVHHKRVEISCPLKYWFEKALTGSGVKLLPVTPEIATLAVELHEHHSDPQDRLIMATAIKHGASLMSSDRKFTLYEELRDFIL